VAVGPLLVLATLLIVAAGLLALIALVAVALVIAFFALVVRTPLEVVRGSGDARDRRRPDA
jgi:hypothetical protein